MTKWILQAPRRTTRKEQKALESWLRRRHKLADENCKRLLPERYSKEQGGRYE